MNARDPQVPRRVGRWCAVVGLSGLVALAGCATGSAWTGFSSPGPVYRPKNVYRGVEKLPRDLKRVAVLPLRVDGKDAASELARPGLQKALFGELAKAGRFELVPVRPEQLRDWTGRLSWGTEEVLPPDFLDRLRTEFECEGVLFSQVTGYRAYPPLAIGWRLRLVDVEGSQVWWAADEWFDAGDASVANAARRHYLERAPKPLALADSQEILYSPLRFGTYTASALAATCPNR
ncbi:MAG: hypothetical protein JNL97_10405 [Verrucomicrobiales bacterium]|nr:hypothetical protein [Verrucomicrobiales bacterium]